MDFLITVSMAIRLIPFPKRRFSSSSILLCYRSRPVIYCSINPLNAVSLFTTSFLFDGRMAFYIQKISTFWFFFQLIKVILTIGNPWTHPQIPKGHSTLISITNGKLQLWLMAPDVYDPKLKSFSYFLLYFDWNVFNYH